MTNPHQGSALVREFHHEELMRFLQPDEHAGQLLARIYSVPFRTGVAVFDQPPSFRRGAAIQVTGLPSSGKTILCMQAAAAFIAPSEWRDCDIGGRESFVSYVDSDSRFDIIQFLDILRTRLQKSLPTNMQEDAEPQSALVRDCLDRMQLVSVDSSTQLLQALDAEVTAHLACPRALGVSLLIIDTIGAFYPLDRSVLNDPVASLPDSPLLRSRAAPPPQPPPALHVATGPPHRPRPCRGDGESAGGPAGALTLQRAHHEAAVAVQRLLQRPVVALLALRAAVAADAAGHLQHRPYLPRSWQELVSRHLVLFRQSDMPANMCLAQWQPAQHEPVLLYADGHMAPQHAKQGAPA